MGIDRILATVTKVSMEEEISLLQRRKMESFQSQLMLYKGDRKHFKVVMAVDRMKTGSLNQGTVEALQNEDDKNL